MSAVRTMERESLVGFFETMPDCDEVFLVTNAEDMLAVGNLDGMRLPRPGLKEYVVTGLVERFEQGAMITVESIVGASLRQQFDAAMDQIRILLSENRQLAEILDLLEAEVADVKLPDDLAGALPFVFEFQALAWTERVNPESLLDLLGWCYEHWKSPDAIAENEGGPSPA